MLGQKARAIRVELEELASDEFLYFKELIYKLAGISLNGKKLDLVRSRLRPHIQDLGLESFAAYRAYLCSLPERDPEFQIFVNALTTNKTDFFREPEHFAFLTDTLIPQWKRESKNSVRIWCCAASTGEEPYSLAMTLENNLPPGFEYEILATDIDTEVLARAKNGVYSAAQSVDIPDYYRERFVTFGKGNAEGWMRMNDEIHRRIKFDQHNLISDTANRGEKFDVIFCRNVLIYFSKETVAQLMVKLHSCLNIGGCLIIGHSESILESGAVFRTIFPSVFKKI